MSGINKLTIPEQFKLGDLLKAEYLQKDCGDADFAKYATDKLRFAVQVSNVASVRNALGIQSWKDRKAAEKPETLLERLVAAEKAIGTLIRRVDALEHKS